MKRIEFKTYKDYIQAQRKTSEHRKLAMGPFFNASEIEAISDWMYQSEFDPRTGICHGARGGLEIDEFQKHFPNAKLIGTDLFPKHGKTKRQQGKSKVLKWDFAKQKPEWIGAFDFVYSNSLDHAADPVQCIGMWLDQLAYNGSLFVRWGISSKKVRGGDCFGGWLWDYIQMIDTLGEVVDLIWDHTPRIKNDPLQRKSRRTVTIAARRRKDG